MFKVFGLKNKLFGEYQKEEVYKYSNIIDFLKDIGFLEKTISREDIISESDGTYLYLFHKNGEKFGKVKVK